MPICLKCVLKTTQEKVCVCLFTNMCRDDEESQFVISRAPINDVLIYCHTASNVLYYKS